MPLLSLAQPAISNLFGYSVDIDDNGHTVIGAPQETTTGKIHVFKRVFTLLGFEWDQQTVLANYNTAGLAELGTGVAISGDYIIAGAPSYDNGLNNNQGVCNSLRCSDLFSHRYQVL